MKIPQRVVSLGGNCMLTKEMRTFFGIQAANLFDWWITPGDALIRLIEADFEDLFAPENLQFVGKRQSVANLRYGNLHHHDFPRNDAVDQVVGITPQHLQRNRAKFAYLKQRWDDLGDSANPVLFVRYMWNTPVNPLLEGLPLPPLHSDAHRLIAALDRKFPRLDYEVLLVDAPEAAQPHPKIHYRDSGMFTQPGECLDAANLVRPDNAAIFSRIFSTVTLR